MSTRDNVLFLIFGLAFGLALSRSGATDYGVVQDMFLLQGFQMYGIILAAVVVTAIGLQVLRRSGTTMGGEPIKITPKPVHHGNIVGGALFGIGWSLTGMCPGPIIVNIGEGKVYALAVFAGVLAGTWLVGRMYPQLSRSLGMPALADDVPPASEPEGTGGS